MEKFRNELIKALMSDNLYEEIYKMMDLIKEYIPEWIETIGFNQHNKHHCYTVSDHILSSVECVLPDEITRLALFFHDIGKPKCFTMDEKGQGHFYRHEIISADMTKEIMERLEFDEETTERVYKLVRYHLFYRSEIDENYVRKMMNRLGEDMIKFFKVIEADKIAHNPPYDFDGIDKMKKIYYELVKESQLKEREKLKISGKDLIEMLKFEKNNLLEETMKFLKLKVQNNPEYNYKEKLIDLAYNFRNEKIWRQVLEEYKNERNNIS